MTVYCGVDFHARQQTIAYCDTQDGEIKFIQLKHDDRDALRRYYTQFQSPVIVGLEAGGYSDWFERFLEELGIEAWFGNPTEVRRRARSRQKNDWRDAELLLDLLMKNEFPRVFRQNADSRAVLAQLRYRHKLVQMRTQVTNSLHALAIREGLLSARRGKPKAKVAVARKLLVRAYILLRDEIDYATYLRRTVAVRSARN